MSKRSDWIEKVNVQEGVKLGILSADIFMYYVRYKEFLELVAKGETRYHAMVKTSEYLNVSRRTIERAVIFFED